MSKEDELIENIGSYLAGAKISKKQRDELPEADFGLPKERKFPVADQDDIDSAAKLIGKVPAADREKVKQRLIRIAKRKNLKIPEAWSQ